MVKVTWVGDADETVKDITQYGYHFRVDKPTSVKPEHAAKFEGNPFFKIEEASK